MPPACKLSRDVAIDLLVEAGDQFSGEYPPPYSDPIWKILSKKSNGLWSAHNWRVSVKENRRGILTEARKRLNVQQLNILQEEALSEETDEEKNEESIVKESDSEEDNDEADFDLVLSPEEWQEIKPLENDHHRTTHTLRPNVWTNVVSLAFWKQWRLPCAFVFKRGEVNVSDTRLHFIKIKGVCRSKKCNNRFRGYVDKEPSSSRDELLIRVKARDTTGEPHENVRRPLNGNRRKQLGKAAVAEGSANNVRKQLARENLRRGDIGGPNEPSLDVLRHAKKEAIAEELGTSRVKNEDMIQTIERMKYEKEFMGSIIDTGYSPYFTFYGTSEQKSAYKQYHYMHRKTSTISIDSTGSVVRKLKRPLKLESAHIFLYTIMIHFNKSSISVFQMLSESQESEKIEFWLRTWLRTVDYQKPNELVIDGSEALRIASCRALNDLHIKHYMAICFEATLKGQQVPRSLISTFIRLDTSHFIQVWCRLKCLNNHPVRQVRDFYIRLIAIMMDCQNFQDFLEVFMFTCIVSFQEFDDSTLKLKSTQQKLQNTAETRMKLEDLIRKRPIDVDEFLKILEPPDDEPMPPDVDLGEELPEIGMFFKNLKNEAVETVSEGSVSNFYRLPAFGDKLVEYAKIFPLWTSVCLPYYAEHATSSYNERGFREVKRDMCKKYTLPQDVDNFLRIHLRHLIGGSRDFSGELLDFRAQAKKVPEPRMKETSERAPNVGTHETSHNDSVSRAEENWRNKGTSYTRLKYPDLEQTEYSIQEPELSTEELRNEGNASNSDSRVDIDSINTSTSSSLPKSPPVFSESFITSSNPEIPTTPSSTLVNSSHQILNQNTTQPTPGTHMTSSRRITETEGASNVPHEFNNNAVAFYLPETPSPDLVKSNDRGRKANPTYSRVKKPSNSKFFMSCPEAVVDLTANKENSSQKIPSKSRTKRRNYLLRNAVHCGTFKIDGKVYFMRRTCAFDSLASILVVAALDDYHYRSFMEQAENETLSFILKFRETGATADLYKERFRLLKPLYESTKSMTSMENLAFVTSYVATDNPTDLWAKLFEFHPSTFHTSECNLKICEGDSEHKETIQIDHAIIRRHGLKALQKALDFHPVIYNKTCVCGHATCTETSQGNNHIYIELGTRTAYDSSPISVRLNVIPAQLTLDTTYRLVGIIVKHTDHFTAFCRRASGHWQEYDDVKASMRACKAEEEVAPIGAIYIKIISENAGHKRAQNK